MLFRSGTISCMKEQLNNISRGLDNRSLRSLRISEGMLKGPEALLILRLEISSSIPDEQVGKSFQLVSIMEGNLLVKP